MRYDIELTVDGRTMWTTHVPALDETGGEVLAITAAGATPQVTVGQVVRPVGLEAIPRNNNGNVVTSSTYSRVWRRARELG